MRKTDLPSARNDEDLLNRIKSSKPVFFLDYDGTLTPIVNHPEDAVLSESMRSVLKDLAKLCTVAIVSGRDKKDVQNLVGLDGLIYAGSHGFDISGPGGMEMQNEEGKKYLPLLDSAEERLKGKLEEINGAQLERKKFSLAIHYRNAGEEDAQRIKDLVEEAHKHYPTLRKSFGKKVIELQPDIDWNKGKAVLWLMKKLNMKDNNVLPVYIGDDLTDEDAFDALDGIGPGILVGDHGHKTKAQYLLHNVNEVEEFMKKVIKNSNSE